MYFSKSFWADHMDKHKTELGKEKAKKKKKEMQNIPLIPSVSFPSQWHSCWVSGCAVRPVFLNNDSAALWDVDSTHILTYF